VGVDDLEEHLQSAAILQSAAFPLGGAHPEKRLLVLEGNVAALAKPGHASAEAPMMCRCEAAAWVLARELGWPELVPITAFREVPVSDTGETAEASVQILLPLFRPAAEAGANPASCDQEDSHRAAIFDAIAANTDRNDGNWGLIAEIPRVKLLDHGYAIAEWPGRVPASPFIDQWHATEISDEDRRAVEGFLHGADRTRLHEFLDEETVTRVLGRARNLVELGFAGV
jgi:hypothetical protein